MLIPFVRRRGASCRTIAVIFCCFAVAAIAQGPPVGDVTPPVGQTTMRPPRAERPRALSDAQRVIADCAMTGDLYALSALINRFDGSDELDDSSATELRYEVYAFGNPLNRFYGNRVGEDVELDMRNGRKITGTVESATENSLSLTVRWRQFDFDSANETIRLYWGSLGPDTRLELLKDQRSAEASLHTILALYGDGKGRRAKELLDADQSLTAHYIRLREAEPKPKHQISPVLFTRAEKMRRNAMTASHVPREAEDAVNAFIEHLYLTQTARGSWYGSSGSSSYSYMYSTGEYDLRLVHCLLRQGYFPGAGRYGDIVKAYVLNPYNVASTSHSDPFLWGLLVAECYAFTGDGIYRWLTQQALQEILRSQAPSGLFEDSQGNQRMSLTEWAVEALFFGAIYDIERRRCLQALTKVRDAMRGLYNEKTGLFELPQGSYDSTHDDAHAIVILRFVGDPLHPFAGKAADRILEQLQKIDTTYISQGRYSTFHGSSRAPIAEVASILHGELGRQHIDKVITPFCSRYEPRADVRQMELLWHWVNTYNWANVCLGIEGYWRYDWKEVEKVARQLK